MNSLPTFPAEFSVRQEGLDLAKRMVNNLLGQGDCRGELTSVIAERLGYRRDFAFEGVEVSSAFYAVISFETYPDMTQASVAMKRVLAKVEHGLVLSETDRALAASPCLGMALTDCENQFCFSLADLCGQRAGRTARLDCISLSNRSMQTLDLTWIWAK